MVELLGGLGVAPPAADGILSALGARSLDDLAALLAAAPSPSAADGASGGSGEAAEAAAAAAAAAAAEEALSDLRRLWALAEGYGYSEWLVFDAGVVRGLAYYTGESCHSHCLALVMINGGWCHAGDTFGA